MWFEWIKQKGKGNYIIFLQFNIPLHFHLQHELFWNCWSHKAKPKLCSSHGFGNYDATNMEQCFHFFPSSPLSGHSLKSFHAYSEHDMISVKHVVVIEYCVKVYVR